MINLEQSSVAKELVELLKANSLHIAVAESCTGGLVAKSITDVPGASDVFECGLVTYSNEMKKKLLGVDATLLEEQGPINAETAVQMAEGARRAADADIGVGITGVAGPGPDGDHPEGEMHIGLSDGETTQYISLKTGTENERDYNRAIAAKTALQIAVDYIKEREG
ncbi:MAG: CinA family protein [Clostridia bacterium]|nr:CinA family protein [Clostridia bacterium]